MKKTLKVTKTLIAVSFLIGIIAFVTPVMAAGSNRILLIAKGDDLDLAGTTNSIIAQIELSEGGELTSTHIIFHSKIYDESGEKVYEMKGMTKNATLVTDQFMFFCPVFSVWFINVWWFNGEGTFKTSDTVFNVFFRNSFPITMPNTEGHFVPANSFIWVSSTGEYYESDPDDPNYPPQPIGEVQIMEPGWALAGVFWNVGIPMDVGFGYGILPVGPVSYLTKYMEI